MIMFERRFSEAFDNAERVPVWTRPNSPKFTAFATTPGAHVGDFHAPPPPDPGIEEYARGFQDGYAAAHAAASADTGGLDRLAAALGNLTTESPAALGTMLAESVMRLVRQVVGEVTLDATVIAERAHAVAAIVADEALPARLRMHPEDVARMEGVPSPLDIVPDASLKPGTVVAETANGLVEDGPAVRLERLRAALDAMASRR
ncbi:flagellar assembly protein FliH [Sphingomonas vulcanisoli]|uniref:Flagellar assembly protein FliH n=1 Tax=Sphingomonas vulcanisoli TaxID=1658060 RepID=A0ABX0TVL1_9SPHN|nr:FliH/SctL family protein [Sphingomonas vulcanisoli]NIJ09578.1 flagellar assembly protein FliH [Sphingomonas vulcanisoli]